MTSLLMVPETVHQSAARHHCSTAARRPPDSHPKQNEKERPRLDRATPATSPRNHTHVLVHWERCLQGSEIPAAKLARADSDIRARTTITPPRWLPLALPCWAGQCSGSTTGLAMAGFVGRWPGVDQCRAPSSSPRPAARRAARFPWKSGQLVIIAKF